MNDITNKKTIIFVNIDNINHKSTVDEINKEGTHPTYDYDQDGILKVYKTFNFEDVEIPSKISMGTVLAQDILQDFGEQKINIIASDADPAVYAAAIMNDTLKASSIEKVPFLNPRFSYDDLEMVTLEPDDPEKLYKASFGFVEADSDVVVCVTHQCNITIASTCELVDVLKSFGADVSDSNIKKRDEASIRGIRELRELPKAHAAVVEFNGNWSDFTLLGSNKPKFVKYYKPNF